MAFKGITFNEQNVSAKNDGGLYEAHFTDGVLWGCAMSISGNNLVVGSGQFIMAGRVVEVDGSTNVDLSGRSITNGYLQVIMTADMSAPNGSQWGTSFVQSATTTFPALTQNDINFNGTKYQIELAVIQVSGGSLTSITRSLGYSGLSAEGGFYANGTIDFGGGVRVIQNGLPRVSVASIAADNDARFYGLKSDGTVAGGLDIMPDGQAYLFDGGTMHFRPNGRASTTGEVTIDTTGQVIGGRTLTYQNTDASVTCPVDADTTIQSVTGLSSSGIYLVTNATTFVPSASTNTQFRFSIVGGSYSYTQSVYTTNGGASHMVNLAGLVTGTTSVLFVCRPYSSTVNCTCDHRRISLTRLA